MKICGIISEYNPFHSGHAYQIEKSREKTGADYILCVMSGHFTQRGEPAIFDKWIRAEAALNGGADIVLELPLLSALQSAEGFASGGIGVLNAIGADAVSFGSETQDLSLLYKTAQLFCEEPEEYAGNLKSRLEKGASYPYARLYAASKTLRLSPDEQDLLSSPNAILAVEYIKAIIKSASKMQVEVVKRTGSAYNEGHLRGTHPSATALRNEIKNNGFSMSFSKHMPKDCALVLKKHLDKGFIPVYLKSVNDMVMYCIRKNGKKYLKSLCEVAEGLENRFCGAATECSCIEELLNKVKTKRYTHTRLSRILMYALLGITKDVMDDFNKKGICCARVLGIKSKSEACLSEIIKRSRVPVIINPTQKDSELLKFEMLASDIYALTQDAGPYNQAKRDLTQMFVKV